MKIKLLLFIVLFSLSKFLLSQSKTVTIKMHKGAYYDVFCKHENGTSINLTKFKPWVQISDLKVSPDGNFFFFRYKKKGQAYRLVLYNFNTLKKLAESVPGFGGTFQWNNNNQIIHSWGCGTNCANLKVYDTTLKEQFFTLSSSGFNFSPDNTLLSQLSFDLKQIWVFDLNTLTKKNTLKGYSQQLNTPIDWEYFKFQSNNTIIINNNPTHNIDLSEVKWTSLHPKNIDQFYERTGNR